MSLVAGVGLNFVKDNDSLIKYREVSHKKGSLYSRFHSFARRLCMKIGEDASVPMCEAKNAFNFIQKTILNPRGSGCDCHICHKASPAMRMSIRILLQNTFSEMRVY